MATVTFDHVTKGFAADVIAVNDLNLEIADLFDPATEQNLAA